MRKMMSNFVNKAKKATFVFLAAGIMVTSAPAFAAQAAEAPTSTVQKAETKKAETKKSTAPISATVITEDKNSYMGCNIIDGTYMADGNTIPFKYTDGFFKVAPEKYQPHMATTSMNLTHVSTTVEKNGDYSHGPDNVIEMLKKMGFTEIIANDAYRKKPTTDSIGFVVARKHISETGRDIVSITIRSAGYEKEWASNVTLGEIGEAKGFATAADEVFSYVMDHYMINNKLDKAMKDGKVDFWVQGYSRGGAVANLSAKRLMNKCHGSDNRVYAYCIEAPQGGAGDAVEKGVDYTKGIHNIINSSDLVPYVAPTAMGFQRYGVDHYLSNADSDETKLQKSTWFQNNLADNKDTTPSAEQLEKVKKQIKEIVKDNPSQADGHMPYSIVNKRFSINKRTIDDSSSTESTPSVISGFVNALIRKDENKVYVSRKDYATGGMQEALRNVLATIFEDGIFTKAIKSITKDDVTANLPIGTFLLAAHYEDRSGWGNVPFVGTIRFHIDGKDISTVFKFSDSQRKKVVDEILKGLRWNPKLADLFNGYPGGADKAFKDLTIIGDNLLKGVGETDKYITVFANISGILQNHTMIQTLAWLRTYDSWYEASAK